MTFDDYARNLTETIDDNRLQAALETNGQSEHLHDKRNNYGRVINLSCKHKQKANDERERERKRKRLGRLCVHMHIYNTDPHLSKSERAQQLEISITKTANGHNAISE